MEIPSDGSIVKHKKCVKPNKLMSKELKRVNDGEKET
jgi:hypothetical protein